MISEIPKTPQQQGFSGFFFCSDNDLITGFSGAIILGSSGLRVDCRRIRTTPRALTKVARGFRAAQSIAHALSPAMPDAIANPPTRATTFGPFANHPKGYPAIRSLADACRSRRRFVAS